MEIRNPFVVSGYNSPRDFCDREDETTRIINAASNGRNLTLISWRRLGKTGLIHHVFYKLARDRKVACFYADLLPTSGLDEFIKTFADAVLGKLDSKPQKAIRNLGIALRSIRPVIQYDTLTGEPQVTFEILDQGKGKETLGEVFAYLKKHPGKIVIALDEFQQIDAYPEKNTEALLRSFIQSTPNVSFIFSGSKKHVLSAMFLHAGRPFFNSTEMMDLDVIDPDVYAGFIRSRFRQAGKQVPAEGIGLVQEWCRYHTWYVQYACNRIFALPVTKYDLEIIRASLLKILEEQSVVYYNYRNLLSSFQWMVLTAVAQEKRVTEPYGKTFISKYGLGSPSSVKTALAALEDKEMVMRDNGAYQVYDVFLSRFLERLA
jgi:hypothetical protein